MTGDGGRPAAPMVWAAESRQTRATRRSRLVELDWALEVLEELNLRGEQLLPLALTGRLRGLGVAILPTDSPTAVLERVLTIQEVYLLHPQPILPMLTRQRP